MNEKTEKSRPMKTISLPLYSISEIAEEAEMDRQTVRRCLDAIHANPTPGEGGAKLYTLRDFLDGVREYERQKQREKGR